MHPIFEMLLIMMLMKEMQTALLTRHRNITIVRYKNFNLIIFFALQKTQGFTNHFSHVMLLHYGPPSAALKQPRNQPVRHSVSVASPVFAVLAAAAVLVAHAAVHQQDGHVNYVEVREQVAETTGGAVGQGAHQVTCVVEVARYAPEAGGHKLAAVQAAVG